MMITLEGIPTADIFIYQELKEADIDIIPHDSIIGKEVPYSITGKVGNFELTRAWCYWLASTEKIGQGILLEDAKKLHHKKYPGERGKIYGDVIRVNGNINGPPPEQHAMIRDEDQKLLDRELLELGYKESEYAGKKVIEITEVELKKILNEGKINLPRYINLYHIDTQEGLNEFSRFVKNL